MQLREGPAAPLRARPLPPQFSKGYRTIQVKSGKAYIRKASVVLVAGLGF